MDEDSRISKVSGYLEKKGKMKMMSSYKKYWFVLEGRLLLYYRSKDEYEAISPCKGSINLGPPCNVKPCASLAGVFQIETRNNTITLRAENREDQTRWMQGIMSALNQNKNAKKLIHFRYSLDELPQQQMVKDALERQNTIPRPNSSPTQTNKRIIQRLQKMGAQSYGGNVINQMANSRKCETTNSSSSKQKSDDITTSRSTVLIENDQYGVIKRNSATENEFRSGIKPTEHIYERISTNMAEINYSVPFKKVENKAKPLLEKTAPNINFEDGNLIDCNRDIMEKVDRPATFLLENETYGTTIIRAIQSEENIDTENTLVLANDQYCSIDKRIKFSNTDSEAIYTEPKCTELIDHNENHLEFSNDQGWKREEYSYSTTKLRDYEKNDLKLNNTDEYEDLDKYLEYAEPIYSPNEDIYSECTGKTKSKLKKEKKKKLRSDNADDEKKDLKLKKTSSFIKRVWKRKAKHKEKETDIEELYETVPAAVVEKVTITDGTAVQMLSELQSILEHKKPILIERLSSESAKSEKNTNEWAQPEETPSVSNVSTPVNDGTAVKMLSELQNILENKKANLTDQFSTGKHFSIDSTSGKALTKSTNGNNITAAVEGASSSPGSEKIRPLLPPKNQKIDVSSPYHDFPKNNQPINKVLPPKKRPNLANFKSLDEILLDLDNEKSANKNKVKKLIKQFSESDFTDNDVVLRTNKRSDYSREEIDSDELNRLLDQLAKVTCAPILSPGATISLISPSLTDEELIKLLPARRRRYSEPDYDIPRPHKSLTNLPRKENPSENVIGSTRFFGPILKPSDINIKNTSEDSPQLLSMSPDSLEPDIHITKYIHQSHLPVDDRNSYTSHNYVQLKNFTASSTRSNDSHDKKRNTSNFENSMKRFDNIIIENDIYAQPKSLYNLNPMKGVKTNNSGNHLYLKSVKHGIDEEVDDDRLQDVYIDSLEV